MYAIEQKNATEDKNMREEKIVTPFQKSKDTYRYYDMGRMTEELKVKESMVEQAKKLISENKVLLEKVSIGYRHYI